MKKFKIHWDIILISTLITTLFIILFTGLLIAEKNTQQIGFTDNTPFFSLVNNKTEKFIRLKYMGNFFKIDFFPIYKLTDIISKYVYEYFNQVKENLFLLFK